MRAVQSVFWAGLLLLGAGCGPKAIEIPEVDDAIRIRAFVLAGEGDEFLSEGKDHLALMRYTEASVLYPYHESIFNKLAVAYARLGRFEEAEKAIKRAIRLNRDYAYAYNTQGVVRLALMDNKGAVRSLKKALRLLEKNHREDASFQRWAANFSFNLGHAYFERGRYEKGREAYQRAMRLNPGIFDDPSGLRLRYASPNSDDPELQLMHSKMYASMGHKELALYYLDRALSFGLKEIDRVLKDEDFQALLNDADFIELINRYGFQVG